MCDDAARIFTSRYDNLIQTAGIRDGASHCAKLLSVFYDTLDTSDVHILMTPKSSCGYVGVGVSGWGLVGGVGVCVCVLGSRVREIDISNSLNTVCCALTLDVISGYASGDFACGLKHKK